MCLLSFHLAYARFSDIASVSVANDILLLFKPAWFLTLPDGFLSVILSLACLITHSHADSVLFHSLEQKGASKFKTTLAITSFGQQSVPSVPSWDRMALNEKQKHTVGILIAEKGSHPSNL